MGGKIPWLVSLIGSLATAELLLSQRPASHTCESTVKKNLTHVSNVTTSVSGLNI